MSYISKITFDEKTYLIQASSLTSVLSDGSNAKKGATLKATGDGGSTWDDLNSGVLSIGGLDGEVNISTLLSADSTTHELTVESLPYVSTAPSASWTAGGVKIALLSSAPTTYQQGYLYFIEE